MMWVDECWKPLGWTRFSEQWGLRISLQMRRGSIHNRPQACKLRRAQSLQIHMQPRDT
jgi:hypothetical protein